jgi:hypothetical protein
MVKILDTPAAFLCLAGIFAIIEMIFSMQENYQPWAIDINAFPKKGSLFDQLKFLLGFAILAPSGHNSQPWKFSIQDNVISLLINKERALEQSDPKGRQLFISIGCVIENLLVAADYFGFRVNTDYFSNSSNKELVAKFSFQKDSSFKSDINHLIFEISKRQTNRNKYENRILSSDFIQRLYQLSNQKLTITVIVDQTKRDQIADIVNAAQIEVMDQRSFRKELSHYIKSNFTKAKFGMPGFTLGIPAIISIIASWLIRRVNLSRKTKRKDELLLKKYTPAFMIISSTSDEKENWINAGRLFERIWLIAHQDGLACAPLAAGVQVGNYYQQLQKIIGISHRPLVFSRLGYASKSSGHSPRCEVGDVLI